MSDLLDQLDQAAIALLRRVEVKPSVAVSGEGAGDDPQSASISEAVRVFQAVHEYAKWRSTPTPKPDKDDKTPSKLAGLKDQLNGRGAHSRRRNSSAGAPAEADNF